MYRDSLASLKEQIAGKRAAVEERARRISPVLLALVPERLRGDIEDLTRRSGAAGDDLASLTAVDVALDALAVAQDEALALEPKVRDCPVDVDDFRPPEQPPPWLIEEAPLRYFKTTLREQLEAVEPEAELVRWGDRGYVARFGVSRAPLVLRIEASMGDPFGHVEAFMARLRTSVPASLPRLEVRRERLHHAAMRSVHVWSELELGDRAFDEAFWVEGDAATASLLDGRVRGALVSLAPCGASLVVSRGLVELTWGGRFGLVASSRAPLLPRAAVVALVGIREALERR